MATALANRYARALADVVTKPDAELGPEKATAELASFLAVFQASHELRSVLVSPAVPPAKKKAVLSGLGARLGLSRTTMNFLFVATDHRRLEMLDEVVAAFASVLDERLGILRAEVASARQIDSEQQSALASRLGGLTGKQVRPQFAVDPALLGGLVTRIGSTIYDGSVRGRLHAIQRRLAKE